MTMDRDVQLILQKLKETLMPVEFTPLHEPLFAGNEWNYVKECLDTGWVSSVGKYVDLLEEKLAEFTGAKHAIAVVNGTAALHASLLVSGVQEGDEVLVPALTFIATANAVAYCRAIPHFVDSEERTLGIDPYELGEYLSEITVIRDKVCFNRVTGRPIRAVVAMHTFGHPVDLDPLLEICDRFHLVLIEDAAESLGSYYKGKHTGNWGKVSAFSFNGNKIMTTGGGGAIVTNDSTLAKRIKHLTTTAKQPHPWEYIHDEVGFNYRMPNINAALGCAQLEQLPMFIEKKRNLSLRYQLSFKQVACANIFKEHEFAQSNYWLNVLLLNDDVEHKRDYILEATNKEGIMTRPVWRLIHHLEMYSACPSMPLQTAEGISRRLINIPSSVRLGGDYE